MSTNFSITVDKKTGRRTKGRGFQKSDNDHENNINNNTFDTYNEITYNDVQKCIFLYHYIILFFIAVEGFVIFITGLHEEATEDDLTAHFSEFGTIQQCHLNLDRRNGFVKV